MERVWDLRLRTKAFSVGIVKLAESFPRTETGRIVHRQLVRSATSMAANYRAARVARSKAEFASKLQIALEEADETCYWLELLVETGLMEGTIVRPWLQESSELAAILMSSLKTARGT